MGDYAKKLFSDGVEIEFDSENFDGMVDRTKALIVNGTKVIYEATFKEGGVFAMADILVRKDNGFWDMYEVKASTGVKDYHLDDASIQWYALSHAINLDRAHIIHIDSSYVRDGDIEPQKLLHIADITDNLKDRQYKIKPTLQEIDEMLKGDMPEIDIGTQCSSPFECDFCGHCWAHTPKDSVFDLYRMDKNRRFELYYKNIIRFEDIPSTTRLTKTQKLQIETKRSGEAHIDKEVLREFIKSVTYPIIFIDFETFSEPIPRFDGQETIQADSFSVFYTLLTKRWKHNT